MAKTAPQSHLITTDETRNIAIDCRGYLDTGELLSGTPTITEVTTTVLTLASKAVSTAELTINGATVAIGEALQLSVAASAIGTYSVKFICSTDASQTVSGFITIIVS